MRTLLTTLLILMIGIMGIQAEENASERKLEKLEKIDKSLEAEFLANNWEIIIPSFEKINKEYQSKNGKEFNLKVIIIVDANSKIVKVRFQNNFERQTVELTMIVQDNMLYLKNGSGEGMMEVKRNHEGKLICVPLNDGMKIGEVWDMKVFSGSVK